MDRVGVFSLECGRLIELSKTMRGLDSLDGVKLLAELCVTRRHRFHVRERRFRDDSRRIFYILRVIGSEQNLKPMVNMMPT